MLKDRDTRQIIFGMLLLSLMVLTYNSYQLSTVNGIGYVGASSYGEASAILPVGVPAVYGEELGVNFDDVSPNDPYKADLTISKLAEIDRSIELTGSDKERYINALYVLEGGISCEYCCGARSIIFENGESACGCAHSYAMRGLAKYLITAHGDEYTDEQILGEVGKWKVLFFPSQLETKASILESQGIDTNYVNLASNKYMGIEEGSSGGGMVGGC